MTSGDRRHLHRMPTFLTPRRWQTQLQRGSLKRNSTAVKPAIWFLQWMKLQEVHDQAEQKKFYREALHVLR